MSQTVPIQTCASIEEALIVWSVLDSSEVCAWISNYHHAIADWSNVIAFGGIRVLVLESELEAAGEALAQAKRQSILIDVELQDWEGSSRRWRARLAFLVFVVLPFVFGIGQIPISMH